MNTRYSAAVMATTLKFPWCGTIPSLMAISVSFGPVWDSTAMTTTSSPASAVIPGYLEIRRQRVSRRISSSEPFWLKAMSGSGCSGSSARSRSTPS